jgi:hypothetical protein
MSGTLRPEDEALTTVYDYDGSGNPIYCGRAPVGSSKDSAVWQIKKFTFSGTNLTDIQFAGNDASFSKVWNSRAGYTYA